MNHGLGEIINLAVKYPLAKEIYLEKKMLVVKDINGNYLNEENFSKQYMRSKGFEPS